MLCFNCFIFIFLNNIDLQYIEVNKLLNNLEPEHVLEIMNDIEKDN